MQDLRVTLIGAGPEARRWAWALASHAALASGDIPRSNALVVAPGAPEPLPAALEALSRGLPVLWAAGGPAPKDLTRGPGSLRVYDPSAHDPGLARLKRFVAGKEPFWRPQYIRLAAPSRSQDAVEGALWTALQLAPPGYRTVMAVGLADGAGLVSLTLRHGTGLVVQACFGLGEHNEVAVRTRDRRLTLGAQKLRISAVDSTVPFRDRVLSIPDVDAVSAEAKLFVSAVAAGNGSADNRDRWRQVVRIVEAARTSISEARPVHLDVTDPVNTITPPFEVIVGGGRSARVAGRRLTLVS